MVTIDNIMKKSKYLCSTIVLANILILLLTGKMKNDRSGEEGEEIKGREDGCWIVLLSSAF